MADYIVVPVADSQLTRVAIGMLYAERNEIAYPMPGPTLYIWDPQPNATNTAVAFGPLDSLSGEEDFGAWCLGRQIETESGPCTIPAQAETLTGSWFPAPVVNPY